MDRLWRSERIVVARSIQMVQSPLDVERTFKEYVSAMPKTWKLVRKIVEYMSPDILMALIQVQ